LERPHLPLRRGPRAAGGPGMGTVIRDPGLPARMVAAILLAAGGSSRMGGEPKGLQEIPSEGPVLARMARVCAGAELFPVLAVVGYRAAEHRDRLSSLPLHWVEHPGWARGRTSSAQAGLRALGDDPPECLLWPVDAPLYSSPPSSGSSAPPGRPGRVNWSVPAFRGSARAPGAARTS
ncbi:4-diphosphocytidyl-2C-methyl-D-erythritol synthase, partial [mine drainage metagenome]